MTAFIDYRQQRAVLLLGAFHGMPHAQFSLGLDLSPASADELIGELRRRRWVATQPASKHQREWYGQNSAIALTPVGRMVWKRLLAAKPLSSRRAA